MKKIEFTSSALGERYTLYKHSSGLSIYHFPKEMSTVYAILSVPFGSIHDRFAPKGVLPERLPSGVAHFLEHKLFDSADGTDAFARFSALGADANAYTTYDRTAYLFSCTEHFSESLGELLGFVRHPYFTAATVKKERGIIAEEIRMYEDSPWEQVYQNLLSVLYEHHPVRDNICGTVESIEQITPEMLYGVYEAAYRLCDMVLVVCGNVSGEEILAVADRALAGYTKEDETPPLQPLPDTAPPQQCEVRARMDVAKPIFYIGIKDDVLPDTAEERVRRDFAMTMLNELLFSQAGAFYNSLFEEGIITPSFSSGYSSADGFGFNCLGGESAHPEVVLERLWDYVERVKREGLCPEDVERVRRVLYSDELRAYDSTEEIANRLLSFVFEGADIFSAPKIIAELGREELEALLASFYQRERCVLSVIEPLDADQTERMNEYE